MITPANMSSTPPQAVQIRFDTLRALNATRSKTRSLPSELLSNIFQHACQTSDGFDEEPIPMFPFHLILRLVSTLWYDIVQSTPQSWSSVFLPQLRAENIDIKGRYLKLCLESSGSLPLTLNFRFERELRKVSSFISPTVDATLEHSTHRIRALRLLQPPRSWLKLVPKMCQLAAIHISDPQSDRLPKSDEILVFPKTANINRICILRFSIPDFRLECVTSSVTHVDLFECPHEFVLQILLQCPNLIDFRCLFPLAPLIIVNSLAPPTPPLIEKLRTMLTAPLVLSHLSTFTWSTNGGFHGVSEFDIALFQHLHFPALQRFNWWSGLHLLVDDTPLALPLSRFSTVTTLELVEIGYYCPAATLPLNHFLPFTSVTQLRLRFCHHNYVEQAFSVLSHGINQSNVLFPKLTSIVIDCPVSGVPTPPWPVFSPESGNKLARMLRSRVGLMDEFTLTVELAHLTRRWNDEVWHSLRELKRDGLDLTIIEYGHPIILQ